MATTVMTRQMKDMILTQKRMERSNLSKTPFINRTVNALHSQFQNQKLDLFSMSPEEIQKITGMTPSELSLILEYLPLYNPKFKIESIDVIRKQILEIENMNDENIAAFSSDFFANQPAKRNHSIPIPKPSKPEVVTTMDEEAEIDRSIGEKKFNIPSHLIGKARRVTDIDWSKPTYQLNDRDFYDVMILLNELYGEMGKITATEGKPAYMTNNKFMHLVMSGELQQKLKEIKEALPPLKEKA